MDCHLLHCTICPGEAGCAQRPPVVDLVVDLVVDPGIYCVEIERGGGFV